MGEQPSTIEVSDEIELTKGFFMQSLKDSSCWQVSGMGYSTQIGEFYSYGLGLSCD